MLILVLGTISSKTTIFVERLLQEIPGYGPNAKYRLFIQPSKKDYTELNIEKLVYTHRYLARELGYNHMIIEAINDSHIPPSVRANANFVVFTDLNAFEKYFCRGTNLPITVDAGDILRARDCVTSEMGVVIFNMSENKFKQLNV